MARLFLYVANALIGTARVTVEVAWSRWWRRQSRKTRPRRKR